ncbi:MAG: DUF1016 N-terminal domain-containing protein [Thermoguttaceae bacterium]
MREVYHDQPKLSPLLRELPWTHNLLIMSRCKRDEEREFYLRVATRERWSFRELQRQLSGALFERTALSPVKLSTPLAELHPAARDRRRRLGFLHVVGSQAVAVAEIEPAAAHYPIRRRRPPADLRNMELVSVRYPWYAGSFRAGA